MSDKCYCEAYPNYVCSNCQIAALEKELTKAREGLTAAYMSGLHEGKKERERLRKSLIEISHLCVYPSRLTDNILTIVEETLNPERET